MLTKARHPDFKLLLAAAGLGLVISTVVILVFSLSWQLIAVGAAGLLALMPALTMKDAKPWWLTIYLFLLPFEAGKRISNLGQSPEVILNTLGLPPSGDLGIKLHPTDLALLALVIPWLLRVVIRRERIAFPRVGYLLVAYMVWAGISSVIKAESWPLSVAQLAHELKYFVIFVFTVNVLNTQKLMRIAMLALLLGLSLETTVAVTLNILGTSRDRLLEAAHLKVAHEYEFIREQESEFDQSDSSRQFRAAGTFGSASNLALYLQLQFALPLVLAFSARSAMERRLSMLLFALSVASLYVSASRSGMFGFALGSATCMYLVLRRGWISKERFTALVAGTLFLALIATPLLFRYMTARPETYKSRFALMREGLQVVAANPLLGVGLNNGTAARLRGTEGQTDDELFPVHNHYIVLASETGLIGFTLYLAFFAAIALEGVRRSRSEDPSVAAFSIAIVSGYAALATQLMGDHFVGNAQHTLLWFFAGLVVALGRIDAGEPAARGSLEVLANTQLRPVRNT